MNKTMNIKIDLRLIIFGLLGIILVMLAMWQPWSGNQASRKITVSGNAKIKAEPDFYNFNPQYQRLASDNENALNELKDHVNNVTASLEKLGIDKRKITLQINKYDHYGVSPEEKNKVVIATLSIKIDDKELAQKVQDYLLTTEPEGTITPIPGFTEEKRKKLENEARGKAIADAQSQAEKTARQLGARLGKVIEVKDAPDAGFALIERGFADDKATGVETGLAILAGEQEITFGVEAVFAIR